MVTTVKTKIEVENIGCQGCVTTIKSKLSAIKSVTDVAVDVATGMVSVDSTSDVRAEAVRALAAAGYPERGTKSGLAAASG